jgi:hypothetical protein
MPLTVLEYICARELSSSSSRIDAAAVEEEEGDALGLAGGWTVSNKPMMVRDTCWGDADSVADAAGAAGQGVVEGEWTVSNSPMTVRDISSVAAGVTVEGAEVILGLA